MRLSRKARRRMERKRIQNKKRLNKYPIMSVSLLLALNQNLIASGATLDDVRELIGETRLDEMYTQAEQRRIELEYGRIESYNRIAKMFKTMETIDISHEVEKKREKILNEIGKKRNELKEAFSSGKSIDEVLRLKTSLDTLIYEESKLRDNFVNFEMELQENIWEDQYKRLKSIQSQLKNLKDIGDIGVDMKSPVRGLLQLGLAYGMYLDAEEGMYKMHTGIDLVASEGDDVLSQWNGVVTSIFTHPFEGETIEITHDTGLKTYYKNLKGITVSKGDTVEQYQKIGEVSGSNKTHLHFEVHLNDTPVNPIMLYGKKGIIALQEYASTVEQSLYVDMRDLIEQIKERPEWLEIELSKKKNNVESSEDSYYREETTEGITVQLKEGHAAPKPSPKFDINERGQGDEN